MEDLRDDKRFGVEKVGTSYTGKQLYGVRWGKGEKKVILWSQMHGDEPTPTKAILDIWAFLKEDDAFNGFRDELFDSLELYFIPVLNPDGMNLYQRRTSQGIDMNRDALRLQTPEARILRERIHKMKPMFGFNLHDQSPYYSAGQTNFPAALSFLAPAFNEAKDINPVRRRAMELIGVLNDDLQQLIPGHIGRYDDTFNVRAFGDNIQKWGVSTILVESGAYQHDPDKEYIRKLNFLLLLRAFEAICNNSYEDRGIDAYESLPFNVKENFCDLMIRNAVVVGEGGEYKVDIAVNREEVIDNDQSVRFRSAIFDMGDLSQMTGYEEFDAAGRRLEPGRIYPYEYRDVAEFEADDYNKILRNGYTAIQIRKETPNRFLDGPLNVESAVNREILPQQPADFIVTEEKEVVATIVNGFVVNLQLPGAGVANGVVRSISQ